MATLRGNPVAWQSFYTTARWRRLRKFQLMQHPLCKFCLQRGIVMRASVVDHVTPHKGDWTAFVTVERGIVTAATLVDHVVPHKGDWTKFVTGELQSLCEPCHNSAKRQIELRGYRFHFLVGRCSAASSRCRRP